VVSSGEFSDYREDRRGEATGGQGQSLEPHTARRTTPGEGVTHRPYHTMSHTIGVLFLRLKMKKKISPILIMFDPLHYWFIFIDP
jgi:hypothetical protein